MLEKVNRETTPASKKKWSDTWTRERQIEKARLWRCCSQAPSLRGKEEETVEVAYSGQRKVSALGEITVE